MNKVIKAMVLAGLVTGMAGTASLASAAIFNPFTVQEPGSNHIVNADKITGNYSEVVKFTPTSATTGNFITSVLWNAGTFVTGGGNTIVPSYLNSPATNGYGLYATFTGGGSYQITNPMTGLTQLTFTSGALLGAWLDPGNNTTFSAPTAGNPWNVTPNGADTQIVNASALLNGAGLLDPSLSTCGPNGINCGSFGTKTQFNLNGAGAGYFILPVPFYNVSFQSGQFNNFNPTVTTQQSVNGSMDVTFATVPEPASLALVGLGLLGMGVSLRRRKRS